MESKLIINPEMEKKNLKIILEANGEEGISAEDAEEHDKKLFEIAKKFINAYGHEYKDIGELGVKCFCVKHSGHLTTVSVRTDLDINGKKFSYYYAPSESELEQLLKG